MRKLMWFTIGFAPAVGLCAYVGFFPAMLIALTVCAIGAVAASIRWKKLRIPAFILAGAATAMVFFLGFRAIYLQPASIADGKEQVISAEVTDYSYETDYGGAVEATVSGKKELVKLSISQDAVDPDDVEMLEDMIMAAANEAFHKMEEESSAVMAELTGGLGGLGGLSF